MKRKRYSVEQIAGAMGRDVKLVRRIMNKYGLKTSKRRKKPRKRLDEGKAASGIPNRIKGLCPIRPDVVWVGDFTFLDFYATFIYLATVLGRYYYNNARIHTALRMTPRQKYKQAVRQWQIAEKTIRNTCSQVSRNPLLAVARMLLHDRENLGQQCLVFFRPFRF